jgi:hypothetical protein
MMKIKPINNLVIKNIFVIFENMIFILYKQTKMTKMKEKECKKCCETKSIDKFSRYNKSKDGYQYWCRDCNNGYQYANTDGKLYQIVNPIGERYYGTTKATLNKRISRYKWTIKNGKQGPPLLLKSFIQFGLENHKISLIKNLGNISRDELFRIEKEWIKKDQPELNINYK